MIFLPWGCSVIETPKNGRQRGWRDGKQEGKKQEKKEGEEGRKQRRREGSKKKAICQKQDNSKKKKKEEVSNGSNAKTNLSPLEIQAFLQQKITTEYCFFFFPFVSQP